MGTESPARSLELLGSQVWERLQVLLSRTVTNSLVHSELCHTLMSKRDGPGDKATRLGTEVSQEIELGTGTCSVLQC